MTKTKTVVWKIVEDFLADKDAKPGTNANAVGITGPRGADDTQLMLHRFRMYDDDGNLYYEGVTNALDDELGDEESVFAPLDNFGMPNAGCTRIDYWNPEKHEWETV